MTDYESVKYQVDKVILIYARKSQRRKRCHFQSLSVSYFEISNFLNLSTLDTHTKADFDYSRQTEFQKTMKGHAMQFKSSATYQWFFFVS